MNKAGTGGTADTPLTQARSSDVLGDASSGARRQDTPPLSNHNGREQIDAAAIRYRRVTYSVPRPGRHGDVIRVMNEKGLGPGAMLNQGFVTSAGRFVNRCEAFKIATEAGQIIHKHGSAQNLYSEDLW